MVCSSIRNTVFGPAHNGSDKPVHMLCFSHTQCMDVDENSQTKIRPQAPLGMSACAFKVAFEDMRYLPKSHVQPICLT